MAQMQLIALLAKLSNFKCPTIHALILVQMGPTRQLQIHVLPVTLVVKGVILQEMQQVALLALPIISKIQVRTLVLHLVQILHIQTARQGAAKLALILAKNVMVMVFVVDVVLAILR